MVGLKCSLFWTLIFHLFDITKPKPKLEGIKTRNNCTVGPCGIS
jgi:hypothetical protein